MSPTRRAPTANPSADELKRELAAARLDKTRLLNETKEALERQTAVSEVLAAIGRSGFDAQPVFDLALAHAGRLCGANHAALWLRDGDQFRHTAQWSDGSKFNEAYVDWARQHPTTATATGVVGRVCRAGAAVQIADVMVDPDYPKEQLQDLAGAMRTLLGVPLLKEGTVIGVISLVRGTVKPFSDHDTALMRTFADQAAIAIENVRLFNETKEALERQTAISDVLRVISASPTDLGPVLDAVAESAVRFCGAEDASVMLLREDGYEAAAHYGPMKSEMPIERYALDRGSVTGRAILELRTVHAEDVTHDDEFPLSKRYAEMDEQRTVLAAPLIREGKALGAIALRRGEPRPFTGRQIELAELPIEVVDKKRALRACFG